MENKEKEERNKEIKHVGDWRYIIDNWDDILKNSRSTIIRSIRIGVPTKYRGDVWYLLTGAKDAKAKADFTYESLDKVESNSKRIISVDVPRTLPKWTPSGSVKILEQLERLLNAYANVDPELGYTQGMNFIAAIFLLYQSEEEAFWSFYALMFQSSLPHRLFFIQNFPKLRLLKNLVDTYIAERFPNIFQAFEKRGMDTTIFTPMWFMVCFLSANLDLEMSTFIFEQFLAFGVAPLLSFGLGILELHKNVIENDCFESLLHILSNPGSSPLMSNKQEVNVAWGKHWITTKEYKGRLKLLLREEEERKAREKEVIEENEEEEEVAGVRAIL